MNTDRIPVLKMNIQLNTNVGDKPELFRRSMLKLPKMDEDPNVNSDLPYFTKVVKYPSWIQSRSWKERMEFFFNREIFTKTLRDELTRTGKTTIRASDAKNKYKVEKHNVMIMLRSLFPIPEKYANALKSSYDHILMRDTNTRIVMDIDLKQALNVFGLMYRIGVIKKEREEYFLTVGGKEYDVEDVVWENDVVNHPLYFKFLVSRQKMYDSIENTKDDVAKKYGSFEKTFNSELEKSKKEDVLKTRVMKLLRTTGTNMGFPNANPTPDLSKINDKLKNNSETELIGRFQNTPKYNGIYGEFATEFNTGTDKAAYDEKVKECVKAIKNQDTLQSLLWNLDINVPDSAATGGLELDKIRDRIAVKGRIKSKLESMLSGSLMGDEAAKILISVRNDLDEHAASRGERSTVFINGDYEKYFDRLLKYAVQVRAAAMVEDFVKNKKSMNLTDKKMTDGSEETPIVKRLNKFIRETFPTQAKMNNDQATSVAKIYEPERKTFNADLYNILFKIRNGEDPPDTKGVEPKLLDEIYEKYASIDKKVQTTQEEPNPYLPYLYVGVEEVKPSSGDGNKDKNDLDVEQNVMEVYLWINLVDAKKMEDVPKSSCKLYDKMLEQELRELTDLRHRGRMLSRYRNLDFDSVVSNPIKEPVNEAVKKGGRDTRKLRMFSKQTTAKNYH